MLVLEDWECCRIIALDGVPSICLTNCLYSYVIQLYVLFIVSRRNWIYILSTWPDIPCQKIDQNPFLTAQSTQIKSVISVPMKDFIHHFPRALFNNIPRVGAQFYDIPGFNNSMDHGYCFRWRTHRDGLADN